MWHAWSDYQRSRRQALLFDITLEMRAAALCLAALVLAGDALSAQPAAAKAKRVLVPIADGTEEIEVVTVVDVLRRAGAEVVLASVEDDDRTAVTCSRGVKIEADCHVKAVTGRQGGKEGWDLIAIPGGAPDQRLMQNSVAQWIAYQTSNLGVAGSSPVGVVGRHAQFPLDRHAGRRTHPRLRPVASRLGEALAGHAAPSDDLCDTSCPRRTEGFPGGRRRDEPSRVHRRDRW